MGLYKNTNGVLSPIAGRGKAEYGASTVRTGTVSIPQSSAGASNVVSVTFDKPMPDNDYLVTFECSTSVIDLRLVSYNKTASGFSIGYYASAATSSASTVKYTAFKLYTDTEYNDILTKMPELLSGRTTILSSSDDLDTITEPGTYSWNDTENAPANVPGNLTYAILFHVIGAAGGNNEQQLVFKGSSGVIYMRSLSTASPRVWGPWNQVDYHKAVLKTKSITFPSITIGQNGYTYLVQSLPAGETIPSNAVFAQIGNFNGTNYTAEGLGISNKGSYVTGKPNGKVSDLKIDYYYYE